MTLARLKKIGKPLHGWNSEQLIALILQILNMFYWAGENDDTLVTEDQKTIPDNDNERI